MTKMQSDNILLTKLELYLKIKDGKRVLYLKVNEVTIVIK